MEFSLNEEQRLLRDSVQRFVANEYGFERRRQVAASSEGVSKDTWLGLAELGLLGLNIPESHGGIGAGPVETMLVSEVFGAGLLLEPYLSSAVLATHAIVDFGTDAQQAKWLPSMCAGDLTGVLAHEEDGASTPYDFAAMKTTAIRSDGGWLISGHKCAVYHAPAAQLLLVSACVGVRQALALFAVPVNTPGVKLRTSATVDSQCAADIEFDRVYVPDDARLGVDDHPGDLGAVLDVGIASLCAEGLGALQSVLDMTVEYCKTRVQFGVPIGKFQALQHRVADMRMHFEQARSMAHLAASACMFVDRHERRREIWAAKVIVSQAARFVGQAAVQIHGGMGMTDELAVSHYFKRLLATELRFGNADAYLALYARGA